MNTKNETNLIWIDLEMTGLNPEYDHILEVASLITNSELKVLAEGPVIAIHRTEPELDKMDNWNKNTHTKSGLIDRVKTSSSNNHYAEIETINFLKKWVPPNTSPICGNSISQDRRFLFKYMPKLEKYFHYRCLDVSSLKELAYRWKPEILTNFKKKCHHKAKDDIYESIAELLYYRKYFLQL